MTTMKSAITVTLVLLFASLAAPHAAAPKQHIVFIYADDWGWGDLSCHGHPWLKTPNIDRLASEGTDFQQFNVLNPVCSPSWTAVMTGHFPARYSIHQHFAAPAQNHERGMPDRLNPKGAPLPEAYGYDEASVFNGGEGWPSEGLHDTAKDTVAFIQANKDKPFFINVWIHESHTPHVPTDESMAKWEHLDEQKQVYSAAITDGDNAVGTILAALKDAGVEQNTLVMFSSDNGREWAAVKAGPKEFDRDAADQDGARRECHAADRGLIPLVSEIEARDAAEWRPRIGMNSHLDRTQSIGDQDHETRKII